MKRKTKSINVPDELHRDLCIEAAARGKTVGAHSTDVLTKHGVRKLPKHVFGKATV